MKTEINLVDFKGSELIVREGKAVEAINPIRVLVSGNIDAPYRWLEKKHTAMNIINCSIQENKDSGSISLYIDEKSPYSDVITGSLNMHPDYEKWQINKGQQISAHDLAEQIKMNRSDFKNKEIAMKLVKDLRNFTAKVHKELEAFKDDRANYALKKSQIVETNLPESFILVVPIFKGQPKESIEVEINIDADRLTCSLVSPSANDYISQFKETIIDAQIEKIRDLIPSLAIIEV